MGHAPLVLGLSPCFLVRMSDHFIEGEKRFFPEVRWVEPYIPGFSPGRVQGSCHTREWNQMLVWAWVTFKLTDGHLHRAAQTQPLVMTKVWSGLSQKQTRFHQVRCCLGLFEGRLIRRNFGLSKTVQIDWTRVRFQMLQWTPGSVPRSTFVVIEDWPKRIEITKQDCAWRWKFERKSPTETTVVRVVNAVEQNNWNLCVWKVWKGNTQTEHVTQFQKLLSSSWMGRELLKRKSKNGRSMPVPVGVLFVWVFFCRVTGEKISLKYKTKIFQFKSGIFVTSMKLWVSYFKHFLTAKKRDTQGLTIQLTDTMPTVDKMMVSKRSRTFSLRDINSGTQLAKRSFGYFSTLCSSSCTRKTGLKILQYVCEAFAPELFSQKTLNWQFALHTARLQLHSAFRTAWAWQIGGTKHANWQFAGLWIFNLCSQERCC